GRPGAQRLEDVLVGLVRRQHQHPYGVQRAVRADAAGGLQAVGARHADVHEHHVGARRAGQLHRLHAVRRLGDDDQVVGQVEQGAEPGPHHRLVVRQQDPDHGAPPVSGPAATPPWAPGPPSARGAAGAPTGSSAVTRQPPPGSGPATSRPPTEAARSRIPIRPKPSPPVPSPGVPSPGVPSQAARASSAPVPDTPPPSGAVRPWSTPPWRPSSVTSTLSRCPSVLTDTLACRASACLITLVSASCTIR